MGSKKLYEKEKRLLDFIEREMNTPPNSYSMKLGYGAVDIWQLWGI